MTVEAQRRLYKRIIQQRNIKEIRLHNKHVAVIDKYTTALCQHTGIPKPRQPLPDYMHWYESSGELHYLTYEARKNLPEGPWDGMAGFLLPSTILNLPFVVISHPPNDILLLLSILAWVTLDEANEYIRKKDEDLLAELERDTVLEQWISHPLYQSNTKIQLEKMCRDLKIPVKQHSKHELVRLIVEKRKEPSPDVPILYLQWGHENHSNNTTTYQQVICTKVMCNCTPTWSTNLWYQRGA